MTDTKKCDGCGKVIRDTQDRLQVAVTAFSHDAVALDVRLYDLHNDPECADKFAPIPWEPKQ